MLPAMGWTLVVAAALAIGTAVLHGRARRPPDKIEVVGSFQVVTHTTRYLTGWNTGRLGTATTEHYSLRFRGKLFAVDGKAGFWGEKTQRYESFNSIITFPSPEPAIVVNVGDPNNTSFFYLVREVDGEAAARYLGESSGGVSAEWLDPPVADVLEEKNIALHRGHLEGGRWLLLGDYTVLDTQSLESYPIQPAKGFTLNNFKPTLAMSPEGGSFVRYGSSTDWTSGPMLAVFEIKNGASYTLPIDRARMRYNDWVEVDAAWLDHHFEWKKGQDGRYLLLERAEFDPVPYRGRLTNNYGHWEYKLEPVEPEMRERFVAFLESEYGARLQPPDRLASADELLIGQKRVNLLLHEDSLGVFMELDADSQLVEEIARKFDDVLATGELDDLFESSLSDRHTPPDSATARAGSFRATVVLIEDEAAFRHVWNRPPTATEPPLWTVHQATIGKPINAFVFFSGCARDEHGRGFVEASFDVLRQDGSSVVAGSEILVWNAPAPPDEHLRMAQQRLELVFDEEERPGTYLLRCSVCDRSAGQCVQLSLHFELEAERPSSPGRWEKPS